MGLSSGARGGQSLGVLDAVIGGGWLLPVSGGTSPVGKLEQDPVNHLCA